MKTTGFRSVVLYLVLGGFAAGIIWLCINFLINGNTWAMQPYNGHVYAQSLGEIRDGDGNLLAYSQDGQRFYSESETARMALMHTVGDPLGYVATGVQTTMRARLSGYNLITGMSGSVFNQLGNKVTLTVKQQASVAAYEAMGYSNGAVVVYNYKTGDILAKVSKPTFDPLAVPEDVENNEAYKGVYLDNNLSSNFTPGSIFKIVTCAAAMEKWPDTWMDQTYDCEGMATIGGDTVSCLSTHGTQNMGEAMGNSCNLYFAYLSQALGGQALQKKAQDMGFNQQLMFGEVAVAQSKFDVTKANENELAWASVGQYTALSNPYHMMVLMGAIANEGEYVPPRLTGDWNPLAGLGGSRTLTTSVEAANLKVLLRSDVEQYYGDSLFPQGMEVCGKTGTGEVGGGKGPNCWMVGFSQNPSTPYAFAVVVEDGVGGIETAGYVASQVLFALAS